MCRRIARLPVARQQCFRLVQWQEDPDVRGMLEPP